MARFQNRLVHGEKPPYDTWTFLVLPPEAVDALEISGRVPVRGTLAGTAFRGTVSKGEGVYRMSVPRALLDAAGVRTGDLVEADLERDPEPRPEGSGRHPGQAVSLLGTARRQPVELTVSTRTRLAARVSWKRDDHA